MPADLDLLTPLKHYWGYSAFRPLQERIVRSLVAGHDTCVVMPTGGGKSLCYQLPALVSGRTAVVISPLIALMQDQAAQLAQMGIPAAVLNSTQSDGEQSDAMAKARAGAYRLLYISPERAARGDTIGWLQRVPIAFFAIDEAHCISEWGHEFRPEYRQLSRLRTSFPDRPIAAFTASATRHVRHDILAQLQLRNPDKYIASFHRTNLRYLVHECGYEQMQLLVEALRSYAGTSVIVYSPTINRVEETVDFLEDNDIPAVGYHGKMGAEERRRNQERWMSDEVRVMVGTIAFGLGINKPAVRAVIHLSLPKSIEQYYQEAGRAGRDGLSADCVLLWQKKDAGLLGYFANKIIDKAERERAWERYRIIREFVEAMRCRHRQICTHFGETPKWQACNACDVCGCETEWLRQPEPLPEKAMGKKGVAVTFTPAAGPSTDTEALREYLREWRRNLAKEKNVPAYMVLHDSSLEEICARPPKYFAELYEIAGIGERKAELYGQEILNAVATFHAGARAARSEDKVTTKPADETVRLLREGKTLEEIAEVRGRQFSTVVNTVAHLLEAGEVEFRREWVSAEKQAVIKAACARAGIEWLKPLKDILPPEITYDEIRLVVAWLRREAAAAKKDVPA